MLATIRASDLSNALVLLEHAQCYVLKELRIPLDIASF